MFQVRHGEDYLMHVMIERYEIDRQEKVLQERSHIRKSMIMVVFQINICILKVACWLRF